MYKNQLNLVDLVAALDRLKCHFVPQKVAAGRVRQVAALHSDNKEKKTMVGPEKWPPWQVAALHRWPRAQV